MDEILNLELNKVVRYVPRVAGAAVRVEAFQFGDHLPLWFGFVGDSTRGGQSGFPTDPTACERLSGHPTGSRLPRVGLEHYGQAVLLPHQ